MHAESVMSVPADIPDRNRVTFFVFWRKPFMPLEQSGNGPGAEGRVSIRIAVPGDVDDIHRLIGELAEYERLTDKFVGSPAELRHHLFGPQVFAHALLAQVDGQVAGFALYFHNYSTFLCRPGIYLEDLFVRPQFRGRGIGRQLLATLARQVVDMGGGRLEWAVLDWNAPSIEFYRSLGSQPLDEWKTFRLTGAELTRLAADGNAVRARKAPPHQG
jgi:GNAT superfamily N-acetyltransferase